MYTCTCTCKCTLYGPLINTDICSSFQCFETLSLLECFLSRVIWIYQSLVYMYMDVYTCTWYMCLVVLSILHVYMYMYIQLCWLSYSLIRFSYMYDVLLHAMFFCNFSVAANWRLLMILMYWLFMTWKRRK